MLPAVVVGDPSCTRERSDSGLDASLERTNDVRDLLTEVSDEVRRTNVFAKEGRLLLPLAR